MTRVENVADFMRNYRRFETFSPRIGPTFDTDRVDESDAVSSCVIIVARKKDDKLANDGRESDIETGNVLEMVHDFHSVGLCEQSERIGQVGIALHFEVGERSSQTGLCFERFVCEDAFGEDVILWVAEQPGTAGKMNTQTAVKSRGNAD